MDNIRPAIVAVGYNRPEAMQRLLKSIGRAAYDGDDVPLIISIDHSDAQESVRAVAESFCWTHGEKSIRCAPERLGLRSHILACGSLTETYGAVIILEDDLIVAPDFYRYVCAALSYYGDEPCVAGVSLYSHAWNGYADVQFIAQKNAFDTYLGQFSVTWGQCWTARQWREFLNWYHAHPTIPERLLSRMPADVGGWPDTSWGKYFVAYIVESDRYYVMPYTALSTNCEEAGSHAEGDSDAHQVMLLAGTDKAYAFAPAEQAVRYDVFFERMGLDLSACGIDGADVCVDLNGTKRDAEGKRYLLSCKSYALPVVRAFGMRMRPIEANVEYGIAGDAIFLYDAKDGLPAPTDDNAFTRMRYETYRLGWRRLLAFALTDMARRIRGRLSRLLKR